MKRLTLKQSVYILQRTTAKHSEHTGKNPKLLEVKNTRKYKSFSRETVIKRCLQNDSDYSYHNKDFKATIITIFQEVKQNYVKSMN